jgi:uridine kinase
MQIDRVSARTRAIELVANSVLSLGQSHPVRVALDGRTAAGKTVFADQLACAIQKYAREVIRASIDGFHRPSAVRHRQGRFSPEGYYRDARDLDAVRRFLLDPLGPNGDLHYATEVFDLERDLAFKPKMLAASRDAILIVDGTFLQRPELRSAWDIVVFLDVPQEVARSRGVKRDGALLGGEDHAAALYDRRYAPAFALYVAECAPVEQADVVIDNS